jgi:Heparinase II/III-like protein/Heparinase II/III N-terminus
MRSPREISFRLKQELRNVQLALLPPSCGSDATAPLAAFPAPGLVANRLRNTEFAAELLHTANQIIGHKFPLLGYVLETGPHIEWRRDYLNNICTEAKYFRRVPYLNTEKAGDHKNIWELNRHQHLVLLAQAFLFSGKERYLDAIYAQLESWWSQNPYQRGINWTSALEVAFRAFSWIWIFHFAGDQMTPEFRARFLNSLCQHGYHLENNLSFYFSPNTHLLGEAVVLHALGRLFPSFPAAKRWVQLGDQTVIHQMERQVRADGSYFEQSTYYHVYALDMFLFHALLSSPSPDYLASLARMANFLHAVLGPERKLAFLGDDDGGRWFHPFGPRDEFGRATLATCSVFLKGQDWTYTDQDLYPQAAWFVGKFEDSAPGSHDSQNFSHSGICIFQNERSHIIFDAGPFGPGRAGHSHSDALSIVVRHGEFKILVDSGTYTYVGNAALRNAFRGSSAHNTIQIDGKDQANPVGPFWWSNPAKVTLLSWESNAVENSALGRCAYEGFVHQRLVRFIKPNLLLILDRVDGPEEPHELDQFWHLGSEEASDRLYFGSEPELQQVLHSPVFGVKERALCLRVKRRTTLPAMLATAIVLDGDGRIQIREHQDGALFEGTVSGKREQIEVYWPSPSS